MAAAYMQPLRPGRETSGAAPYGEPAACMSMCRAASGPTTDSCPCADMNLAPPNRDRKLPKQAPSPPVSGGTMFGPGISWDPDSANELTIGPDLDLIDEDGVDVSDSVSLGFIVTHVDEMEVANFSQQTVDKLLEGARNSTVSVCMFDPKTQNEVTLELRRHVPEVAVRVGREKLAAVRPASPPPVAAVALSSPAKPAPQSVTQFEAAGNMQPPKEVPESLAGVQLSDLMKSRDKDDRGTLGVRIAMSMDQTDLAPTQIQTVVPGSIAYATRALKIGDDIVAINGVPVSERDIIPVSIGSNVIGSPCNLTVNRDGRQFNVNLIRFSVTKTRAPFCCLRCASRSSRPSSGSPIAFLGRTPFCASGHRRSGYKRRMM